MKIIIAQVPHHVFAGVRIDHVTGKVLLCKHPCANIQVKAVQFWDSGREKAVYQVKDISNWHIPELNTTRVQFIYYTKS